MPDPSDRIPEPDDDRSEPCVECGGTTYEQPCADCWARMDKEE